MTNEPIEATPRYVRDVLQKAYKKTDDFDTKLFNALFAALTMLEKVEARIAALEAAQSAPAPKVLYEGDHIVHEFFGGYELFIAISAGDAPHLKRGQRVHVVVSAAEENES